MKIFLVLNKNHRKYQFTYGIFRHVYYVIFNQCTKSCFEKFRKAEKDVKFLTDCKSSNVYPKFVRWKNIKTISPRERIKYYSRLLNEALDKLHKELKTLRTKHDEIKTTLLNKATFIKGKLIVYSIGRLQSNVCKRTTQRHEKKLDALTVNKHIMDGMKPNPNELVTNLANFELSANELSVLRLGLKHGLLVRPKESEMIAVVEDVWNQIIQRNALKDKHFAKHRVQTALKSFTYSYLDLDSKQFLNDQKHINTIRQLRLIKLIDEMDYYNSMERIFNDKTKFKVVNNDPTFRNLASVQNYLNTLVSRGELTENDKMEMRPKSARLGRAHGLPKIHKDYTNIPSFRPIVDTTCAVLYGVGKYLSNLLNPLTLK